MTHPEFCKHQELPLKRYLVQDAQCLAGPTQQPLLVNRGRWVAGSLTLGLLYGLFGAAFSAMSWPLLVGQASCHPTALLPGHVLPSAGPSGLQAKLPKAEEYSMNIA